MQTYKYQFKASGHENDVHTLAAMLKKKLKDGPDCLMAYCIFPTDSDILDHITIDTDNKGIISAINLHTYTKLWDGMESDLKECVEVNLAALINENYKNSDIKINGDVKELGREGDIPKTLYHIAEYKDIYNIMAKGLIPAIGNNNYKNTEDYVYLASEKDLVPWICILKHKYDPVIFEIDTTGFTDMESGRMFKDRTYIPEGYSEYRTKSVIPPSVIKRVNLNDKEFTDKLYSNMIKISSDTESISMSERAELISGIECFTDMGIIKENDIKISIPEIKNNISNNDVVDDSPPWDENDNGITVTNSWEKEVEDDFTKAIGQMSLTDFGVDLKN